MLRILILTVTIALLPAVSFAQKGANEKALEHASEQSIFNRVGDWFATIGKNDEEKARIKAERKAERAAKKTKGMADDKVKEAESMKGKAEDMKNKAKGNRPDKAPKNKGS